MKRLLLALLIALIPAIAAGQSTVLQGGSWAPGLVPTYSSSGVSQPIVQSAGTAGGGGVGIKELPIIARGTGLPPFVAQGSGPLGTVFSIYDGPITSAAGYHYLSLSANAQGGGLIAYGNGGGAPPLPLNLVVNGTTYPFPFTGMGGGNVVGPGSSVIDNIATYNSTAGTLLKDSGISLASQVANRFLATPSGAPGVPSFRAMAFADLPITGTLAAGSIPIATGSTTAKWTPVQPVSLATFGAICDGTTDTTAQINTALAAGVPLTGDGLTCAVTGDVAMPDGTSIQDAKFIQLSANGNSARRTLKAIAGAGPITLIRVSVNRNGAGSDTTGPGTAAGIYLSGTSGGTQMSGIHLEDVEVYGAGPGMGIAITDATAPQVIRPYVHDITYTVSVDPCSERVTGIFFIRDNSVYLEAPNIVRLTGQIAAGVPSGACATGSVSSPNVVRGYQTDGVAFSGVNGATWVGGVVDTVGECTDAASIGTINNGANANIWKFGVQYRNCDSYGEKMAHDILDSGSVGNSCYRCGFGGLVVVGVTGDTTGPANLRFSSFTAVDTGSNGFWSGANVVGISQLNGGLSSTNVQCIDCQAVDGSGTMKFGFRNETGTATAFRLINPYVSGATVSNFAGFTNGILQYPLSGGTEINGDLVVANLGATTRATTISGAGTMSARYDNAGVSLPYVAQNFGITSTAQGTGILAALGQSSPGVTAGRLYWQTTANFSSGPNQSVTAQLECIQGGVLSNCLAASTTLLSAPGAVLATTQLRAATALPAISACGTSPPAAAAGSSNNSGQFTTGTGTPSACTVTFANAFPSNAFCTVVPANGAAGGITVRISSSSAAAFSVTLSSGTDSAAYNYQCIGN